jgi:cell wall-associated NlpC family hydrolase
VTSVSLSEDVAAPTHWVSAIRTYAFAEPAIRAPAFGPISINALLTVVEETGAFAKARGAGWLPTSHISPIGRAMVEPAAVIERFLGAPYLWGGRDSLGLDCSGLVQQALYACGLSCPRDTGEQQAIGAPVRRRDLRRGDLVFWRGHVGMMLDADRLCHANAHHMAVAVEPLDRAIRRILGSGGGRPTAYRRP